MMVDKKLTMDQVANRIEEEYEGFFHVRRSDDNAQNLVILLR